MKWQGKVDLQEERENKMIRIYKGSIKNEVDEVAIQQEISSYLQLDNINF